MPALSRTFLLKAAFLGLLWTTFLAAASSSRAQDSVTLDFPSSNEGSVLPVGLSDWPKESFQGLAAIEIPLLRLNEEGTLLVTVVFQDDDGRIVLAKWKAADGKETVLSSNIAEGLKGWNQRVLKVPYDLLSEEGSLLFETDAEVQPIKRINLAWTWPTEVFMGTAGQNVEVVQDAHRVLTKQDFADKVIGPVPDAWAKGIWKAFLQEDKETLDDPLGINFSMQGVPKVVILRAKVLGFPLDGVPDVWINGQQVAPVSVQVPDLATEGFFKTADGRLNYAGWRELGVAVPASYFKTGDNSIIFGAQKGAYLKDAFLELNFESEGAPFTVPGQASPASVPTPIPDTASPAATSSSTPAEIPMITSDSQESGPTIIVVPPIDSQANL
jgi:hypothetical protein